MSYNKQNIIKGIISVSEIEEIIRQKAEELKETYENNGRKCIIVNAPMVVYLDEYDSYCGNALPKFPEEATLKIIKENK